ncbi:hypothetical protein PPYR_02885 [Photinus pyralis]|uniref:Uncharacterized protein n=1 Tax=Photinus pyralis TaxID=7054 RepID=A0A5N4A186_PHOPY|nr:TOG array regulator of axonemal microtubules protein 1-like [Photinus pyralis]KAB0791085.1 hypothetical protein PPYR_02885 [Photinus pyralis]
MLCEEKFAVTHNLWGVKEETKSKAWKSFPSCCNFWFRSRKVVDVTPPKISTPIVAVGYLHADDLTKTPSPEATPERKSISQRSVLVRQPFSSSSETSELCTPPAEPHLATSCTHSLQESPLKSPRQSESFVEVDSPRYHSENFTVIEDSAPDVLEENKTFSRAQSAHSHLDRDSLNIIEELYSADARVKREDSFETHDEFESDEAHTSQETLKSAHKNYPEPFSLPKTFIETKLSKSEINIQISPEILRKSVNSAPPLNDLIRYDKKETTESTVEITVLPGSLAEYTPKHECPEVKTPKQKPPLTRQFSRKGSVRSSKRDTTPFPDYLNPFPKAKDGFHETLSQLEHPDWEVTMKGLQGMVRLTRHHPEILDLNMHPTCVALGRHIRNLRSQVARAASLAASEMFSNHKKPLEVELEEIAVPLLHRTADTNKFLRSDANGALDKMCLHMAAPRVVSIITTKGAVHQNAIVRCAAARLLCSLTNRLGAEKTFQLPRDTRDKILHTGANMLMEGNLDTRKHAKMMFTNLLGHSQFNKAMMEAVPPCTMRHIQKTLRSLQ